MYLLNITLSLNLHETKYKVTNKQLVSYTYSYDTIDRRLYQNLYIYELIQLVIIINIIFVS